MTTEPRIETPSPAQAGFWNVPNSLTVSRMVLAVFVFAFISYAHYLAAVIVFAIAAVTDALDGYFARLLNQSTVLGRQLDPLIDKVVVAGCLIYLVTIPASGLMPWMVATIVIRELLIQGLRSHLEGQGVAFGAVMAGKLKTVAQCFAIIAMLLCLEFEPGRPWLIARDVLNWLAVGLTVYSGLGYLALALPRFRGPSRV